MAITLQQPYGEYQSAFNRINYSVISDNATEVGFKFVVKIYDAINNSLITTCYYDAPADPDEYLEFDISNFVNNRFDYITGLVGVGSANGTNDGITKPYYLRIYEYYKVGNDYVIDLSSMVQSATKVALASSFNTLDMGWWETNKVFYTEDTCDEGRLPLTDWNTQTMYLDESRNLAAVNNYGSLSGWVVECTYRNNNNGTSYEQTFNYTPQWTGYNYQINMLNIQPEVWAINGYTLLSAVVSATYFACDNSEYFTWVMQTYTFKGCSGKYTPVRIAYLNRFGVFDYFTFDLVAKQSYGIDKKGYAREYTGSIFTIGYQAKNISPYYNIEEKEKWKLTSDYITTHESEVLRQLYSSPFVYMKMDTYQGRWIPVNVVANSYELKTVVTDKMFNLELDIELPYINKRQTT